MEKSILKNFAKYVSVNILGMIGISCYILADTFFVARALGATGIAALNLSISVYSLLQGIGLLIGIGGATRYSISKSQGNGNQVGTVFATCMKLGILAGVICALIGLLGAKQLASILGGDTSTLPLTTVYLATILGFAPFFIVNNILLSFVRNDNNPNLSMLAMLVGSFSNILLDYIFMFPLKMGIFGAAFATSLAPLISIGVLLTHLTRSGNLGNSSVRGGWHPVGDIFSLGISAFITEVSSAVVLITFNLVILQIKGNLGVAAYGIVANIALVAIAIFTGIAQGMQPLISKGYGSKDYQVVKKVLRYALTTSSLLAFLIYVGLYFNADSIIGIFNSQQNGDIAEIARTGLRIYFTGFFFVGLNIILAMYLSATENAKDAFIISISRGCIVIVPMVLLLSKVWDMVGVWFAFVLTELFVTLLAVSTAKARRRIQRNRGFIPKDALSTPGLR